MGRTRFEWDGAAIGAALTRNAGEAIVALTERGAAIAREETMVQGPPRSVPGEPPHRDQGPLHDQIYALADPEALVGRFGTPAPEGAFTEYGTFRMQARPWLRPATARLADEFRSIVASTMGGK